MSNKSNVAESLENILDGLLGLVTEQGWEGLDRYIKRPFKSFTNCVDLLAVLDEKRGKKLDDMCIAAGIYERKDKKENNSAPF